jgi:hypothetical protein
MGTRRKVIGAALVTMASLQTSFFVDDTGVKITR